ncbi:MAG: hypothetical protein KAU52_03415 [Methanosarcinales archaeon]|nr:hypothetical protein [Methanosarcinales archaeon]
MTISSESWRIRRTQSYSGDDASNNSLTSKHIAIRYGTVPWMRSLPSSTRERNIRTC